LFDVNLQAQLCDKQRTARSWPL